MAQQHYFTNNPEIEEKESSYKTVICGEKFEFKTNNGVFSKRDLDYGTRTLLEVFYRTVTDSGTNLLDMGCGYGPVGVALGRLFPEMKITMADINRRALEMTRKNIALNQVKNIDAVVETDCFSQINGEYGYILTNPPIRAGKQTVFSIYEGAYSHLSQGGALYVVIQKKQGAPSSMKKLDELFGNCEVVEKSGGYHILRAVREM